MLAHSFDPLSNLPMSRTCNQYLIIIFQYLKKRPPQKERIASQPLFFRVILLLVSGSVSTYICTSRTRQASSISKIDPPLCCEAVEPSIYVEPGTLKQQLFNGRFTWMTSPNPYIHFFVMVGNHHFLPSTLKVDYISLYLGEDSKPFLTNIFF